MKLDIPESLLSELLHPIPGNDPGGTDLAYFKEFDAIRSARRADDPSLAQGAWVTEVKAAQWPLVRELCEDLLRNKSKDFQVACWYTEAMTRLQGFSGLSLGLNVLNGLITDFWEFAYPKLNPEYLEERIGKFEWLDNQLPSVLREVPMTDTASGAYSWQQWEESRAVENLGARDPNAKLAALAEGKLGAEKFDKAADASGGQFYTDLIAELREVESAQTQLEQHMAKAFGADTPSLRHLREAVAACSDLAQRLAQRTGARAASIKSSAPAVAAQNIKANSEPSKETMQTIEFSGAISSRAAAVQQLREIAGFFRQTEPHSPVALLADRAARWAEMPLEQWLSAVIKDDSTLSQLRELLDWEGARGN